VKLSQKILAVIAGTVLGGIFILYFVTRRVLLNSFSQLENEQTHHSVEIALNGLQDQFRSLGTTTNDYAY